MKQVTKLMIREYKIKELGYDFMGYRLNKGDIYTFHHLIIPRRDGGKTVRENGAVLCGNTSHQYLHLIEAKSNNIYKYITAEMLDMNIKGYLDLKNLMNINELLLYFEDEYGEARGSKGKLLIKEPYRERMLIPPSSLTKK
jgi:hypothetical protein